MIHLNDSFLLTFFENVYRPMKLRGKSPNTIRLYVNTLGNFERFLRHKPTFDDLQDEIVGGFMAWHVDQGNSPETANKDGGQILALWRFAARKDYVKLWPDVDMMPCPKRTPRAWLQPELEKLFDSAMREEGTIAGVKASLWWRTLLAVVFFTGERIGAVRRLKWDNVDLDGGWIFIPAETRKGRRSDKAFPVPPPLVDLLHSIRSPEREQVFPWPFDLSTLYARIKRILKRAMLPTDRKSKFHRIRKTTASYYKAAGGDPTELLDHADPKTTKKYLDPRICGDRQSATVLFVPWASIPLANGPKEGNNAPGPTGGGSHERKDPERIDPGSAR